MIRFWNRFADKVYQLTKHVNRNLQKEETICVQRY